MQRFYQLLFDKTDGLIKLRTHTEKIFSVSMHEKNGGKVLFDELTILHIKLIKLFPKSDSPR